MVLHFAVQLRFDLRKSHLIECKIVLYLYGALVLAVELKELLCFTQNKFDELCLYRVRAVGVNVDKGAKFHLKRVPLEYKQDSID